MPTYGEYSEVAICNLALSIIGRGGQITSLDENSQSARICKLHYPYARDAVLRAYDWNFAARRKTLTAVTPGPEFEYSNAYQLPPDFLLLRSVYCGEGQMWSVEGNQLLINLGQAPQIKYTALVTTVPNFDPLFIAALVQRIAADLCVSLTENERRAQGLWNIYMAKLQEARRRDAMENPPDPFPRGSWEESRYL